MSKQWMRRALVASGLFALVALVAPPSLAQTPGVFPPPYCDPSPLTLEAVTIGSLSVHAEIVNHTTSTVSGGIAVTTAFGTTSTDWGAEWDSIAPGQRIVIDITSPTPFAVLGIATCVFTDPVGEGPDPIVFNADPPEDRGGTGDSGKGDD